MMHADLAKPGLADDVCTAQCNVLMQGLSVYYPANPSAPLLKAA